MKFETETHKTSFLRKFLMKSNRKFLSSFLTCFTFFSQLLYSQYRIQEHLNYVSFPVILQKYLPFPLSRQLCKVQPGQADIWDPEISHQQDSQRCRQHNNREPFMAHSQSCSFLPCLFPVIATAHMEKQHSRKNLISINIQLQIQGQNSVLSHLPILSHKFLHALGKNTASLHMPELIDYDRKCRLIFCFTATHITNCLAAIHSFTRSVNNYSVKSDGTVQVTKVSRGFFCTHRNCQAGKSMHLKGKLHTGGERLVGPPKGLLSPGKVRSVCSLGACVFIIIMSPQVTSASVLPTHKPSLYLLDFCAVEQVRTAPRAGCAAPLIKPWLCSRLQKLLAQSLGMLMPLRLQEKPLPFCSLSYREVICPKAQNLRLSLVYSVLLENVIITVITKLIWLREASLKRCL